MPNINMMKDSNFLKKEDCGTGILVTIRDVKQENVAKQGAPEELKWCLHVDESEKPMVLNTTNATIIASILGSAETEDWVGKKIVLYSDPNVMYAGKIVGGIRARAQRVAPAARSAPTVPTSAPAKPYTPEQPPSEPADNIPF